MELLPLLELTTPPVHLLLEVSDVLVTICERLWPTHLSSLLALACACRHLGPAVRAWLDSQAMLQLSGEETPRELLGVAHVALCLPKLAEIRIDGASLAIGPLRALVAKAQQSPSGTDASSIVRMRTGSDGVVEYLVRSADTHRGEWTSRTAVSDEQLALFRRRQQQQQQFDHDAVLDLPSLLTDVPVHAELALCTLAVGFSTAGGVRRIDAGWAIHGDTPLSLDASMLNCRRVGDEYAPRLCGVLCVMSRAAAAGAGGRLVDLQLEANRLGDAAMASLGEAAAAGSLESLTCLNVRKNRFSDEGMCAFARALRTGRADSEGAPTLAKLQKLCLMNNQVGDDGLAALARAGSAGAMPVLAELFVQINRIGSRGCVAMAEACAASLCSAWPRLAHLNLSWNPIGDAGLVAIGRAVSRGAFLTLSALSVFHTKVGDAGVIAVCEAAKGKGALASLSRLALHQCAVGDKGALAIATCIRDEGLPQLTTLWLHDNTALTDAGADAMASVLARVGRTRHLKLTTLYIENDALRLSAAAKGALKACGVKLNLFGPENQR